MAESESSQIRTIEDVMDATTLYLRNRNVFKRGTDEAFEVRRLVWHMEGAFAQLHVSRLAQLFVGDVASEYHDHRD